MIHYSGKYHKWKGHAFSLSLQTTPNWDKGKKKVNLSGIAGCEESFEITSFSFNFFPSS